MMIQHNPPHPGAFIKRVYINPHEEVHASDIASELGVSSSTFNRLINEKSSISSEMAVRLSEVLGRSAESWLAMQNNFDLNISRHALKEANARFKPIRFENGGIVIKTVRSKTLRDAKTGSLVVNTVSRKPRVAASRKAKKAS